MDGFSIDGYDGISFGGFTNCTKCGKDRMCLAIPVRGDANKLTWLCNKCWNEFKGIVDNIFITEGGLAPEATTCPRCRQTALLTSVDGLEPMCSRCNDVVKTVYKLWRWLRKMGCPIPTFDECKSLGRIIPQNHIFQYNAYEYAVRACWAWGDEDLPQIEITIGKESALIPVFWAAGETLPLIVTFISIYLNVGETEGERLPYIDSLRNLLPIGAIPKYVETEREIRENGF